MYLESTTNRDNLWNLAFASLMTLGIVISGFALVPILLTITCVPLLIKFKQNVSFDKERGKQQLELEAKTENTD